MGGPPLLLALDLSLDDLDICYACLGSVAIELEYGYPKSLRRAINYFGPLLWEDGLEAPVREALERARRDRIPGAAWALADVERRGVRAPIVSAIVWRLARDLARHARAARAAALN